MNVMTTFVQALEKSLKQDLVVQEDCCEMSALHRHESNSQQAIIMELSCEESCCSAGNNQAAEQAGITQHSWQLSSR